MISYKKLLSVDTIELKKFGILMGLCFPLFFSVIFPKIFKHTYSIWPIIIGTFFVLLSLVKPILLKYFYIPWMLIGGALGWINSKIILGIVFYLVFTPIALYFRITKRDSLNRKLDSNVLSYRINLIDPFNKKSMERPF